MFVWIGGDRFEILSCITVSKVDNSALLMAWARTKSKAILDQKISSRNFTEIKGQDQELF